MKGQFLFCFLKVRFYLLWVHRNLTTQRYKSFTCKIYNLPGVRSIIFALHPPFPILVHIVGCLYALYLANVYLTYLSNTFSKAFCETGLVKNHRIRLL